MPDPKFMYKPLPANVSLTLELNKRGYTYQGFIYPGYESTESAKPGIYYWVRKVDVKDVVADLKARGLKGRHIRTEIGINDIIVIEEYAPTLVQECF